MEVQTATYPNTIVDHKAVEAQVGLLTTGDLNLKTREGDLVSLSFGNEYRYAQSRQETVTEGVVTQEISTVAQAAARYSLSIQGDLNEDELNAIKALAEGVQPLAEEFFKSGEFDFNAATETLTASLGQLDAVELKLERVISATFAFQQTQVQEQPPKGNAVQPTPTVQPPVDPEQFNSLSQSDGFLNYPKVRDITDLVLSVIETEFPEKGLETFGNKAIVSSLKEFLDVLKERLTVALEGAQPANTGNAENTGDSETSDTSGEPQDASAQDLVEV